MEIAIRIFAIEYDNQLLKYFSYSTQLPSRAGLEWSNSIHRQPCIANKIRARDKRQCEYFTAGIINFARSIRIVCNLLNPRKIIMWGGAHSAHSEA